MGSTNKKAANACEALFDEFVIKYGGELIEDVFPVGKDKPKNADYLLENRNVIAELKCLQKEFFNDAGVGKKAEKILNSWLKQGKIPQSSINGN